MADTDTASTSLAPTVVVEDAGPARKRLTITIPADQVTERIETSFGALQSEASVPGFRRGRVPRALLERRFGQSVLHETRSQLLADATSAAIRDKGLEPVAQPEFDGDVRELAVERGKPLTFAVDVEVVPEFELPNLEGVPIRRPVIDVTDEHIDAEIRRNRYRFGTPSRIEGPFQPLDRLLGRVVVTLNDAAEPFFESNDAIVVVPDTVDQGRGQLLGILFEDLGPKLEGRKVGDEIVFETTGPESHEREEIRGAKVRIVYAIRDAERITPLSPEELAEQFGLGTVENLREQVKLGLERRRDVEQRAAMREQVFTYLADAVDFALPEKLSQAQIQRNLDIMRMELLSRGMDGEDVERRLAEIRGASEADTRRRLRLFFILHRLAEHFKVTVSDAEVNGRIAQMAASRNLRPDQVRAELQRANRLGDVALSIREAKAADRIIDRAVVTDVTAEEWNAEAEARRRGTAAKAPSAKSGTKGSGGAKASKSAGASKAAVAEKGADAEKPAAKAAGTSKSKKSKS